jgi:hypothetical protein
MTDEVFWSMVDKTGDCWVWTGPVTARTGYGKAGRRGGAHRVAYELLVGPIPEDRQLDHLCRNRLCVNPRHLELVTVQENLLRGETRAAHNAAKTHCVRGHELTGDNVRVNIWINKKGQVRQRRKCRVCAAIESAETYQRRKMKISKPDA